MKHLGGGAICEGNPVVGDSVTLPPQSIIHLLRSLHRCRPCAHTHPVQVTYTREIHAVLGAIAATRVSPIAIRQLAETLYPPVRRKHTNI